MDVTGRDPGADQLLAKWSAEAHQSMGSSWLTPGEAEALALYAARHGEGVRLMEARAFPHGEASCDPAFEIIGADPYGENWEDHIDPAKALRLVRTKLRAASDAEQRLRYKIWLSKQATKTGDSSSQNHGKEQGLDGRAG